MLVNVGNIDVKLLGRQTELVADLADYSKPWPSIQDDSVRELLDGVWNLLGAIRDQVDPPIGK